MRDAVFDPLDQTLVSELRSHGLWIRGAMKIFGDLTFEAPVRLVSGVALNCSVGAYSHTSERVSMHNTSIGRYCSIADRVMISPGRHLTDRITTSSLLTGEFDWYRTLHSKPDFEGFSHAVIGNDVWIGANAVVMAGITVGDGAIIGASAVVTKDVEPYTVVAGVPAVTLRRRFDDKTINRLLALAPWNYDLIELLNHGFISSDSVSEYSLDTFENSLLKGKIKNMTLQKKKLSPVQGGLWSLASIII